VPWRIIFLISLGVVVVVGLVLLRVDQGPTYEGRTVKSWLVQSARTNDMKARKVLREMGGPAVAFELKVFSGESLNFNRFAYWLYQKSPAQIKRHVSRPVSPQELQREALYALLINEHAHEQLPKIVALLSHTDQSVRSGVPLLINRHIKPEDSFCVPELIKALNDPHDDVRARSATILGYSGFGEPAKAAVKALLPNLNDRSREVRYCTVRALIEIDSNNIPAVSAVLNDGLNDQSAERRLFAAESLLRWCNPGDLRAVRVLLSSAIEEGRMSRPANPNQPYWMTPSAERILIFYATPETQVALKAIAAAETDAEMRETIQKILDAISKRQ
jgi:hypothetical protein